MRFSKLLAWTVLAAGVVVTGAQAKADERDARHDIAADRYRLAEAVRCGRFGEAAAIRRDIARDESAVYFRERERDRDHDRYRDRDRDFRRDYDRR